MLNKEQFKEFQLAINHGLNPNEFSADLDAAQMYEKRIAMENNLDVSRFTSDVSSEKMRMYRQMMELGVEINDDLANNYSADQLREIKLGKKYGLDTKNYSFPYLSADQMRSMRLRMMANNLILHMRQYALRVLEKIEEKIVSKPVINSLDKEEKIRVAVVSLLKNLDLKDQQLDTVEKIIAALEQKADEVQEIDPSDEIISDLPQEDNLVKRDDKVIDVLNTFHFAHYRTFALLKLAENDFAIVNEFKIDPQTKEITFKENEHYDNVMDAAIEYQELIVEAEKELKTVKQLDLNMIEWELLGNHDDIEEGDRLSILQNYAKDIHPAILISLAKNPNESSEIRNAAKTALNERMGQTKEESTQSKAVENAEKERKPVKRDKNYDLARNHSTGSSILHTIATKSKDERVLLAVLGNPNCTNSTMHLLKENENPNVSQAAHAALIKRENEKQFENVVISSSQIMKTFDSREKDKNGNPIQLTVISLPQGNSIGLGATMVIPSKSVKTINESQSSVCVNQKRNFEIRCDDNKQIISSKQLIKELQQPSKTLDDRLKDAQDKTKQSHKKEELQKEMNKEAVER